MNNKSKRKENSSWLVDGERERGTCTSCSRFRREKGQRVSRADERVSEEWKKSSSSLKATIVWGFLQLHGYRYASTPTLSRVSSSLWVPILLFLFYANTHYIYFFFYCLSFRFMIYLQCLRKCLKALLLNIYVNNFYANESLIITLSYCFILIDNMLFKM